MPKPHQARARRRTGIMLRSAFGGGDAATANVTADGKTKDGVGGMRRRACVTASTNGICVAFVTQLYSLLQGAVFIQKNLYADDLELREGRIMAYHSANGREFVGLRAPRNGQQQIVYDAGKGAQIVVTIKDTAISAETIDGVLQEGIHAKKVLSGVLTALKARKIRFDLSG